MDEEAFASELRESLARREDDRAVERELRELLEAFGHGGREIPQQEVQKVHDLLRDVVERVIARAPDQERLVPTLGEVLADVLRERGFGDGQRQIPIAMMDRPPVDAGQLLKLMLELGTQPEGETPAGGSAPPSQLLEALAKLWPQFDWRLVDPLRPPPRRRRKREPPTPLPEHVSFPADRVHQGAIEGLAKAESWSPLLDYGRALQVASSNEFRMVIGYPAATGEAFWEYLRSEGPVAVKVYYALWARCFQETGGDPDKYVELSIPQLCEHLGYRRHPKGGFRTRDKQQVLRLVEAVLPVEFSLEYRVPESRRVRRRRGPIWQRGFTDEERDQYGDLLGSARIGDRILWDPISISFRPGEWFKDSNWRNFNRYLGEIGSGLLKLHSKNDHWAILVGGFYGGLGRLNGYEPTRIAVREILDRTGLGGSNRKHPAEQRDRFETAHERLVDVRVLGEWHFDPDEPADLDWRERTVVLRWPVQLVGHRLQLPRLPNTTDAPADAHPHPDARS